MNNPIPGRVVTRTELEKNFKKEEIAALYNSLRIFPTPYKSIYYVPFETERKAYYVTDPYRIVFEATKKYLKKDDIYFGLSTAKYLQRKLWNPTEIHIITSTKSRKIICQKEPSKKYWRKNRRYEILKQYPYPIYLHRIKQKNPQFVQKGSIAFATSKQIEKDMKSLKLNKN